MQKTISYPQPPASAGKRTPAPSTMRPQQGNGQATAGARARSMKRDTVRKNGGGEPLIVADPGGRCWIGLDIDPRLRLAIDAMFAENDRLRGLLEEAWAWSSPAIASQLGYLDLARRINEALGGEPSGNR